MTMNEILAKLNTIEADDGWFDIEKDNLIYLTINDFEGFDEDWGEIEHDFVNEEAVDKVLAWLNEECDEHDGASMYRHYRFGDVTIRLEFTSYDI